MVKRVKSGKVFTSLHSGEGGKMGKKGKMGKVFTSLPSRIGGKKGKMGKMGKVIYHILSIIQKYSFLHYV